MKMRRLLTVFVLACVVLVSAASGVGDDFTIEVYYSMPSVATGDNFGWDYAFMDMARIGCNFIVISGNTWGAEWAAAKHWGIKGITAYGRLIGYPGEGNWDPCDFVSGIITERDRLNSLSYNGEYVGDIVVGYMMVDEPECGSGLTEDEKNYLRAYADVYHQYDPTREIYVNHCDPPWYDLHQKQNTCSTGATIMVNSFRINDRIAEVQRLWFDNYVVVALPASISGWMGGNCNNINYYGLGPCTQAVIDWLATRSTYQDVYEEMLAAYNTGAKGFSVFLYNNYSVYPGLALVDSNGNDNGNRRTAYSDAAHDIRAAQGWPAVTLLNNGQPFNDRGNYPPGQFTLTADVSSSSGTIEKVVFGKTTDGGGIWTTIEDSTAPYSATFSASSGETVIFRAQAVDTAGKKSIYDAYMIYIN